MLAPTLAFLVLLAPAKAQRAEPPPVEAVALPEVTVVRTGVKLLTKVDQDYQELVVSERAKRYPESESRLVVFRDGVPIIDRGLRISTQIAAQKNPDAAEVEEGLAEDAVVSSDARFAVLATTQFKRPAQQRGDRVDLPRPAVGVTELRWIDAEHPEGKWTVKLEDGRWIRTIVPISGKRGVAIATLADPDERDADMRILGPDGVETLRIRESEGSTAEIVATPHGNFVAVGLLFPPRLNMPNQGITVLDLTYDTRWTYSWTYGDDAQPLSWKIDDTGVLVVTTPLAIRSYDRLGKPIRSVKRK